MSKNDRLTAEQVRTAVFNGSSYASYDGAQYYANGINMQAIADELNATLEDKRQDERIAALEDLIRDMHRDMHGCWYCHNCGSCDRDECMFEERMKELGVER